MLKIKFHYTEYSDRPSFIQIEGLPSCQYVKDYDLDLATLPYALKVQDLFDECYLQLGCDDISGLYQYLAKILTYLLSSATGYVDCDIVCPEGGYDILNNEKHSPRGLHLLAFRNDDGAISFSVRSSNRFPPAIILSGDRFQRVACVSVLEILPHEVSAFLLSCMRHQWVCTEKPWLQDFFTEYLVRSCAILRDRYIEDAS